MTLLPVMRKTSDWKRGNADDPALKKQLHDCLLLVGDDSLDPASWSERSILGFAYLVLIGSLVDAALNQLKPLGCRVILFVDPDPAAVAPVHNTGADGIDA